MSPGANEGPPPIVREPDVYLISRPSVVQDELNRFLQNEGFSWDYSDRLPNPSELVVETAGRLCYISFGTGRSDRATYIANILASRHGSVLEHAVWGFILTGISRSLSHELVRHRAGMAYSQLSQRYVNESRAKFVMPPAIQGHPEEEGALDAGSGGRPGELPGAGGADDGLAGVPGDQEPHRAPQDGARGRPL